MRKKILILCMLFLFAWSPSCSEKEEFDHADPLYVYVEPAAMVPVPGGPFSMGSESSDGLDLIEGAVDEGYSDERPRHVVELEAFLIDETEVSNAQYRACVMEDGCSDPVEMVSHTRKAYYLDPDFNDFPVIWISHRQAEAYCIWAGKRLPTEAEWEKAARGTEAFIYPWGDETPDCAIANYSKIVSTRLPSGEIDFTQACRGDTVRVNQYPDSRSVYGAFNMAGNVSEWVSDWYDGTYYDSERVPENLDNPTGPDDGIHRVHRGGSFADNAYRIRTASRMHADPQSGLPHIGFRCARDAP